MADTTPIQAHRSDEATIAVVLERIKVLQGLCADSIQQGNDIKASLARGETALALGAQRMDQIDAHLRATDSRVTTIEGDKRGVAGIWTGITGVAGALGAFLYAVLHKS